jgi:plasmid stabilization system protein ParE
MVKSKIVWSNRAKKRLYGILEFYIGRDKSKTYAIKIQQLLFKEIKLLLKYPDLGLKTTESSVRGLIADIFVIYYETSEDKIFIHSIWKSNQGLDIDDNLALGFKTNNHEDK